MNACLLGWLILFSAAPQAVEQTLTRTVDLTGAGTPQRVVITINGASWNQPFAWSVSVQDGAVEIFRHSQTDTRIDGFFRNTGFVEGCSGYRACKEKYYFRDLPSRVVTQLKPPESTNIIDKAAPNGVRVVAREDLLKCCTQDRVALDRAVEDLAAFIRSGRAWVLEIPISPVQSDPPLAWSPVFKKFVRVYQD